MGGRAGARRRGAGGGVGEVEAALGVDEEAGGLGGGAPAAEVAVPAALGAPGGAKDWEEDNSTDPPQDYFSGIMFRDFLFR